MTSIPMLAPLDPRVPRWDANALEPRRCPLCSGAGTPRFRRPDALVVRSCVCGTWFVSPAPSPAALDAFYRTYTAVHRAGSVERQREAIRAHRPEDSLLLTELGSVGPLAGKRVLDVGCGLGVFLHLLDRVGAEPYGVDLDPGSVAFATTHLGLSRVQLGTIVDVGARAFDILTMLDFIERPLDVGTTLERAHALLAPGGILALWTPNATGFDRDPNPVALRMDLEHMQYFSCASIAEIGRRFDFTTVHLETLGSAAPVAGRSVGHAPLVQRTLESAKRTARALERRAGLAGLRGRWMKKAERWTERRGDYHLMALLQKR